MGNIVSPCFFQEDGDSSIKLVFWEGNVKIFKDKKKHIAGEIMFEFPDRMVCDSDLFFIGQPIPSLAIEDELRRGQTYFVLPLDLFSSKTLSSSSLAALSSYSPKNKRVPLNFGDCPFEYIKADNGRLLIKVIPEFITKLIVKDSEMESSSMKHGFLCSTPELQKHYEQLVRAKDQIWSPKLETISEYKIKFQSLSNFSVSLPIDYHALPSPREDQNRRRIKDPSNITDKRQRLTNRSSRANNSVRRKQGGTKTNLSACFLSLSFSQLNFCKYLLLDLESAVATTRRLPSDSGVFADWVASSSAAGRAFPDDLSLGFNAGPTAAAEGNTVASSSLWPATSRQINYGLSPEVGMLGLRDLFVVAPASSFHSHEPIISDTHSIVGSNPGTALGVGVGVGLFPLLATAPCLVPSNVSGAEDQNIGHRIRGGGIQLWHNQQPNLDNYFRKPTIDNHCSGNSENGGAFGSAATCQDCGNQAKKDCSHRRCRTCCKSRGFDCTTHVKSTWVPAARRRERQMITAGSSGSTSGVKKPRLVTSQTTANSHTSVSNTTPPRSYETTSSQPADGTKETLPRQVRAPAVLKCVKVTAIDDEEDEYAYQAVVTIGGHVFKGFLYDQGAQSREVFPNISDLHLNGAVGNGKNGVSSTSHLLHPTDIFGTSGSAAAATAFLGVSSYGNGV